MDHNEEQTMEMEALESILGDEKLRAYTGPVPSAWITDRTIHAIKLEPDTDEPNQTCSCDLLFQHTDMYPEELPNIKLSNTRGLTNREVDVLSGLLMETAQENLGMASVFAIMQAAQEWLENKAGIQLEEDPEVVKKREAAEAERKLQEARALGTPVTPESFAVWKAAFQEEQRAKKIASGEVIEEEVVVTKKTGKQYFLDKYALQGELGVGDDELELDEEDTGDEEGTLDGGEGNDASEDEDSEDEEDDDDELGLLDAMVAERS